ncbi:molybdopterin synthase sulfur carrier subunit-like isoform X3 [Megalops cyprinoides]|uniref:molybdopterin synthase sulfur carrier subunit-like isoform X3 n=1 Tax=Megalops cyprinoides TaxID=118141 RepID=UPI001863BDE9|nr:molybdopterin synthase sulfur carrier subunit-like isoform X3 [Megalops cyprinoides]
MNTEVLVLYFAKSAELAGRKAETISVPCELSSLQLWQELVSRHPRLCALREQVVLAVRQEYVVLGDQLVSLQAGDEVAIIPPLSGG